MTKFQQEFEEEMTFEELEQRYPGTELFIPESQFLPTSRILKVTEEGDCLEVVYYYGDEYRMDGLPKDRILKRIMHLSFYYNAEWKRWVYVHSFVWSSKAEFAKYGLEWPYQEDYPIWAGRKS